MSTTQHPVRAVRVVSRPQSPYVGLAPYDEDDAAFFFGRSQEVAIASANLRSARLTILYGPSGVGKSSLLQAGVVHGLREQSRNEVDESPFAICTVRGWLDDPIRTLQEASRAALQELVGDEPLAAPRATLTDSLHAWTEHTGTLLVVLDQFEEYFQYHDESAGEHLTGFAAELARIVNDPNLAVNVLLSIREDAWAKLDRFEGHIPLLFANYIRVDHLDVEAAREAIEAPIAAWNRTLEPGAEPYDIEPTLIGAVLSAAGGGLSPEGDVETAADRVEAPFLQLVLERLWRATVADGEHALTLARLEALGGARQIVERHLLDALGRLSPAEQDAASDCFRFLVSSSKAKIAHPAADLAEWTHRSEPQVTTVLDKLCSGESGRILRAVAPAAGEASSTSYELFHDVLAEPILAWRRVHERERSRRAAQRRLVRVGSAALALVAVLAALSIWALIERSHANALVREKEEANKALAAEVADLTTKQQQNETGAKAQNAKVKQLRARNRSLKAENAGLRTRRNVLDGQIASLRTDNRKLASGIARLNTQNHALAARINRLDAEYDRLSSELGDLSFEHGSLVFEAGILKAERGALADQQKTLLRQRNVLLGKAAQLGYLFALSQPQPRQNTTKSTHRVPTTAESFGIPGAAPGSDSLRRRVEELQRELARQLERRARLTDEAAWLTKSNGLLEQQRDALRKENAQLASTRAALDVRHRKLQRTLGAAQAEHDRLSSQAATRETRNVAQRHAVKAHRATNTAAQNRNNDSVQTIGTAQVEISSLRNQKRAVVRFLARRVDTLLQGAQNVSLEPALAGLLAVKAYQLTPYGTDDASHPGVYNALWFALNRLDANAARDLIAPVAKPRGKVGTTQSSLIVQKICGVVARALTDDEWKRFFPSQAPYTTKSSRPCG